MGSGAMNAAVMIDPRYHDAVVFDVRAVTTGTLPTGPAESTVALVQQLQRLGVATAVCSLSRSSEGLLNTTGVDELFAVRVDGAGQESGTEPGADAIVVLVTAARRLAVRPNRCVVVASSVSAVAAARDGGFALVLGVDQSGQQAELLRSGADAVVSSPAEVTVRTGDRRMSQLPDALSAYPQLNAMLGFRRPAVLFDYDGTLSAIVNDPDAATPVPGVVEALQSLAKLCPVAVLSGRDLADIRERVGLDDIWYAGSHGFESVAPDGAHHQNNAALAAVPVLEGAAVELTERFHAIDGIIVEHKRFAVAVHYRNAAEQHVDTLVSAVRELGHRDGLRVTSGRKVIELRPDIDWDKGKTLQWILGQLATDQPGLTPIYLGDDLTDEDAFDTVRYDGIGIVVAHREDGDRASSAQFSLESPYAVRVFIEKLVEDIGSLR